ncbi:hypothetical protein KP509_34G039400 [Ceratopteris richardii]|uniref:Uncharacterized protein n=1 Tax=Ceratopteris richardii TaxID=49495 RepID=A0A8T2QJ27_CERRI|nr:hypothetical protein KP509_34G039400 [Ceratopteris richardii]
MPVIFPTQLLSSLGPLYRRRHLKDALEENFLNNRLPHSVLFFRSWLESILFLLLGLANNETGAGCDQFFVCAFLLCLMKRTRFHQKREYRSTSSCTEVLAERVSEVRCRSFLEGCLSFNSSTGPIC